MLYTTVKTLQCCGNAAWVTKNIIVVVVQYLTSMLILRQQTFNQYGETNVIHIVFNLLRIKGLYMFRALLVHPQKAVGVVRAYYVSWLHLDWSGTGVSSTLVQVAFRSAS
jgi:hypothetical protein